MILCLLFVLTTAAACSAPYEFNGTELPEDTPAAEIEGVTDNAAFQLSSLEGKVVAIFFGFTYCPDICPMTMSEISQAYKQINATPEDVAVVFVTVDPERDTPEAVAAYASAFDDDFIGVYVPIEEQERLRKAYFMFVEKEYIDGETTGDNYLVSHSDNIYLIDRSGNLRTVFRGTDFAVDDLAADLQHLIAN